MSSNIKILCVIGGVHAAYAYSTSNTDDVIVTNKYKMVIHGSTKYMIYDEKGRHYAVNNSLWYWKWDSVEDWSSLKKGDNVKVKYYGIRSPVFGLFPNIVTSNVKN